jgi:methionyl-tRNA synthetase
MFGSNLDSFEITLLGVLGAWSLLWKGLALWRAGRRNDKTWFIVLLLVNTLGILEILYLFVFTKREDIGKKSEE